jgi:hypothetical protein
MSIEPPYGPPPPQQQSSSTVIWIVVLVIVLVIVLPVLAVAVLFLGCCGLMGFGAFAAFQVPAEAVKQQYANHPVIQEHIGEIQSVSINLGATGQEQQKSADDGGATPGSTLMVFDIRGSKGSGQIIAEQQPGDPPGQAFSKATLRMPQGEFPLTP